MQYFFMLLKADALDRQDEFLAITRSTFPSKNIRGVVVTLDYSNFYPAVLTLESASDSHPDYLPTIDDSGRDLSGDDSCFICVQGLMEEDGPMFSLKMILENSK